MSSKYNKIIIFFLLLSCNFIFLLPISIWNSYRISGIIAFILIFININCFLKNKGKFNFYILSFIFIVFCEVVISKIKYGQELRGVIGIALYYLILLVYFFISYNFDDSKIENIKEYIINISLILSIVLIIQMILYEKLGISFLQIDVGEKTRFGQVRITQGSYFICIGMILSVGKLLNQRLNKKRLSIKNIFLILFGLIDLIFVSKTRILILLTVISIIIMLIMSMKNFISKIKAILFIIICFIIMINFPIMKSYLDSVDTEKSSSDIRKNAIEYFVKQTFEEPIFGAGIINAASKNDELYYIARGREGQFYRDDVGIIGYFNGFGFVGLVWYILLIATMLKLLIKNYINRTIYFQMEKLGLFIFVILSSSTIVVMDAQRIVYLPYILCFMEQNIIE